MKFISTRKPKLRLLLLMIIPLFFLNEKSYGQPASSYGYTPVAGTFTELVGGTAFTAVQADDVLPTATIPLGFTFNFCGVDYLNVRAGSNGYLVFTAGAGQNAFNDISSLNTVKPALFWLWDDIDGANGAATYLTTGTAPNRVFTFQFKNWEWNWSAAGPNLSVQVKLYEGTNVIEYVYRQEVQPGNPSGSSGASIGICDGAATSTYISLNNGTATATGSTTVFTTNIATKPPTGQIYRFTPPVNCSSATGLPTAGTTTVTPGIVCVSQNVTLSFTPATPMPPTTGITYQWQSAPAAAGPWTNVGTPTTATTYTTTTPVSTPLFFRAQVLCNGTTTLFNSAASAQVVITNPGTPTVTNGARCGPGVVNLTATTTAVNGSIRWFSNLTNIIPLATTNTYTTPLLTQNTTYYAAAVTNASLATYNVGLPAFIQNNPFIIASPGWGLRFTVTNTCNIDSVGVYPIGTGTLSISIWDAVTQALVYASPVSPAITGTGVEKRMIYVGALNLAPGNYVLGVGSFTGLTGLHNEGFNASAYPFTSPVLNITAGSQGFGGTGTPNVYYFSYDWKVSAIGGCEGPRVPVTATINPSPVVARTAPAVVCNDAVATITLTPPTPPYPNYTWTPITNLYTNAAATTPYTTGGSATTLYMKTTNVGTQTYYMMAGNPAITTGCTFADTVKIWVQPANVTIKGQPDTICVSGSSKLSLDTIAGYFPGSIQWQQSTNGTTYTDIAGATNPVYNTPVLSFGQNTYYKAIIKAGAAICQTPVKYVVIANPTIISAPDSFNCGPGTVTLSVVTGGNGSAVWYSTPSGGLPVGGGSPFITPFLGATTTYYVSSGGGGSAGLQTVGAGALTSALQSVTPFSSGWGGSKHQYLIRAAELTAAGIPSGASINSLALDVVAGNVLYPGFAISMKNTATTALPTTYEAGTVEVKAPANHTTTPGINSFTFTTPFVWDGISNLLIQTCWSNATTNSVGSTVRMDNTTFVATRRGQTDSQTPANMCAVITPSTSLNYSQRPKFILGYDNRCESARQEVIAYIRPVPVVDLGPDINKCVDAGFAEVLDAGVQPNTPQFLWDNGSVSQVRAVTESGTYSVKVTNQYTCHDEDTVIVILRANPVVELGNDTTVCNGVVLTLNPGNGGIEYFWNTGQTSQSININTPGTYNVFVTNSQGCTKADTIVVNMQGELPTIQGISVTNNGQYTFHFTAVNPQNVIGYDWDFGDGSAHSYQASPIHTYPDAGNYIVVLHLSSTCGFLSDSSSAHILGINQLNVNKDELTVYPNPTREVATILNRGALKMESIEVYNILGQVVYKSKADSKDKHTLNLSGFASGVYTIQVFTDKGTVARKLEIIK
jgi:hypothetical protein